MNAENKDWIEAERDDAPLREDVLYVDVKGYEGPLDLLLDLARRQKLDLANISVLALAEQYLAFIDTIRQRRIEVAADYLVMAAWLAYLKSRLMVPQAPSDDEPSGEEMAAALQFRLKRLEAMRNASAALMNRSRLGRDVFARGAPEPVTETRRKNWDVSLYELLKAYAVQRERAIPNDYTPIKRNVWSLQDAHDILLRMIGPAADWVPLHSYLSGYLKVTEERATVLASSFSASLELARQGQLELRQSTTFGPLLVRRPARD